MYFPDPRLLCLSLGFRQVQNDKSLTPCFLWGSGIIFKPPGGERHPVCRRLFRLGVQMACSCSPWRHARALLFQTAARLPADSLGSASAPGLSLGSRAQPPLCAQPPLPGSASTPGLSLRSALSLHSRAQPLFPGSASVPRLSLHSALSLRS